MVEEESKPCLLYQETFMIMKKRGEQKWAVPCPPVRQGSGLGWVGETIPAGGWWLSCCVSLHLNGMSEARLICHGKMKSLGCCEDFYKKDKRQSGRLRSEILAKAWSRVTSLRARESKVWVLLDVRSEERLLRGLKENQESWDTAAPPVWQQKAGVCGGGARSSGSVAHRAWRWRGTQMLQTRAVRG